VPLPSFRPDQLAVILAIAAVIAIVILVRMIILH
jgi:hypothetical protein